MPSFFYHLRFELYDRPSTQPPSKSRSKDLYVPIEGFDVFSGYLPDHLDAPLEFEYGVLKDTHLKNRSKRPASSNPHQLAPGLPVEGSLLGHSGTSRHPECPSTILSNDRQKECIGPPQTSVQDWRFGPVLIQSIDMAFPTGQEESAIRGKSASKASPYVADPGGLATKGKFVPLENKKTNLGWGIVHLYRDIDATSHLYDSHHRSSSAQQDIQSESIQQRQEPEDDDGDCTTLCILAVPSYMTPSDFLGFVGEQTREDVSHFRLVRTGRANKFMVLMKFRESIKAKAWQKQWNGKLYNSMEPENCHVVFVKSIEFHAPTSVNDPSSFPNIRDDPFIPSSRSQAPVTASATPSLSKDPSLATSLSTKPLAPPTPALVELPTCPVCLERMDETTGLFTIICQHVFHCACLEKWRGSGCPVCRYTQNDGILRGGGTEDDAMPENECSVCGTTENLWICLICGNTGCGRYDSAHAYAHWEATSHSYAMDVASQAVWDYAGDGYVHRLIQNKADGKLVDLPAAYSQTAQAPGARDGGMVGYSGDSVPREKLDSMGMEYAYLLTSQLDSQRAYFEEQVERAVDKAAKAASAAESAAQTSSSLLSQFQSLQTEHNTAKASLSDLERDLQRQKQRLQTSADLARQMTKQYKEEKTMNEALMERIKYLESSKKEVEEKVLNLEASKSELEEQNRDLSFFISGQQKLKELEQDGGVDGREIEGGSVELPIRESAGKKRKGRAKK